METMTKMYGSHKDSSGKTIIVTGGASGIGYEISKGLAHRGSRVILACRHVANAQIAANRIENDTGNSNIKVMELNLASFESVKTFSYEFCQEESNLYALVHNAGLASFNYEETKDGYETVMQVNYFAPFLLTNLLLDKLVESQPSRVVFVSSWAHQLAGSINEELLKGRSLDVVKSYGNSKLCQLYFCQYIADKVPPNHVTFNALHPGTIFSNFYETFPLSFIVKFVMKLFGGTVEDGARTVLYATADPSLEGVSGEYFDDCKFGKKSKYACDKIMQRKVIEAAELVTGVTF